MSIYSFTVTDARGVEHSLEEYKGRVLLIVNTASKCGFTPQYTELQQLHEVWHEKGLDILAFPCDQFANQEPGTDAEIQSFCQVNYGLTFPVFGKIKVNGPEAHPLFTFLRSQQKGLLGDAIKWNFTKFLVSADGQVFKRYAPTFSPNQIAPDIAALLAKGGDAR